MAKILVMEDDDSVRLAIVKMLQWGGYDTVNFPDAQPALDEVDFEAIDLIITNLTMPTPGEEAIGIIRARGVQVPIIVISAYLSPQRKVKLLNRGAQEAVEKPFVLSDFLGLVQKWIAATKSAMEVAC